MSNLFICLLLETFYVTGVIVLVVSFVLLFRIVTDEWNYRSLERHHDLLRELKLPVGIAAIDKPTYLGRSRELHR